MKSKGPQVQERIQTRRLAERKPLIGKPMQQDRDQAEGEDDKASTGGMSSLDFNFLSNFENDTDTLEATTEPADEGTSTLESPSAFMGTDRNLPERSSPSNSKYTEQKLLMESPRRRRIEGTWERCIETMKIGRDAKWTE